MQARRKKQASSAYRQGKGGGGKLERQRQGMGASGRAGQGESGGFCSNFVHRIAHKTDTRTVRTRVYPVILYIHTVILGPKKSKVPLRISEKKILKKKLPRLTEAKIGFSAKTGNQKNFFENASIFFPKFWAISTGFRQPYRK